MEKREGIKIESHTGTWYVIDEIDFHDKVVFLLEHETYGEDANHLIVDGDLNILVENVTDGFDDLILMNPNDISL
jgi:hypothetical protein